MILQKGQWHVRLYYWCLGVMAEFGFNTGDVWSTGRTNVCHYVRTIFVTTPLVFAVHVAVIGWLGYVLVYYPGTSFGWTIYSYALVVIVGVVGGWFAVRWCLGLFALAIGAIPEWKRAKKPKKDRPSKFESFFEILLVWMVAQHRRVCPLITIVAPDPDQVETPQ